MARMPSKRWVEMVEKVSFPFDEGSINEVVWADVAVQLLARQHAKFARLVKKMQKPYLSCRTEEQRSRYAERADMCAEILAALQQGGKK